MNKLIILGVGLIVLAQPALAQPGGYRDNRYRNEMQTGAPPEGAPIAKGVPRGPGSLTGVWANLDLDREPANDDPTRTADGTPVPLQIWALRVMLGRAADEGDGHPYADSSSRCLPSGVPQMMTEPRGAGIRFIEDAATVTILFEQFTNWRQVFLTDKHRPDGPPTYMGDSIGRWQGDTFVIETTNIDTDQDVQGFPHTDKLKITERLRRVSKDRLELKTTIDDPGTFTRPWNLPRRTLRLQAGVKLAEALCTNQRNAPDADGFTGVQAPRPSSELPPE